MSYVEIKGDVSTTTASGGEQNIKMWNKTNLGSSQSTDSDIVDLSQLDNNTARVTMRLYPIVWNIGGKKNVKEFLRGKSPSKQNEIPENKITDRKKVRYGMTMTVMLDNSSNFTAFDKWRILTGLMNYGVALRYLKVEQDEVVFQATDTDRPDISLTDVVIDRSYGEDESDDNTREGVRRLRVNLTFAIGFFR